MVTTAVTIAVANVVIAASLLVAARFATNAALTFVIAVALSIAILKK
jgi:hypothetical protein